MKGRAALGKDAGWGTKVCRDETGSMLLETALSLLLLLSVMLGIIGASEAAFASHFTAQAARDGARYAMVRGSSFAGTSCSSSAYACQATAADVNNYVQSTVPLGLTKTAVTVATTWPGLASTGLACLTLNGTNSPGCNVKVSVRYAFSYGLPLLPAGVLSFQSTSVLPIMQ